MHYQQQDHGCFKFEYYHLYTDLAVSIISKMEKEKHKYNIVRKIKNIEKKHRRNKDREQLIV